MAPHPRISVNNLSSMRQPLQDDIAMWEALGIDHVGLISPKLEMTGWESSLKLIDDAGLRVSNLAIEQHVLAESIEFAAAVGAGVVYLCSGGARGRSWEEAAADFAVMIAPHAERASELGVRLGVEPTNPLRSDLSFVFTLRDTVDLARLAGIDVVADLYACWYERGFADTVREAVDRIALVQINDYRMGTFDTPNRVAIGDGDVPLERLFGELLDAGYQGVFDLEILGPRIEEEGYPAPIARSVERTTEILHRLGA